MCQDRVRSRALITMGLERMRVFALSAIVSRWSFRERASAGPICVPEVTFQTMSKSWRKRDQ